MNVSSINVLELQSETMTVSACNSQPICSLIVCLYLSHSVFQAQSIYIFFEETIPVHLKSQHITLWYREKLIQDGAVRIVEICIFLFIWIVHQIIPLWGLCNCISIPVERCPLLHVSLHVFPSACKSACVPLKVHAHICHKVSWWCIMIEQRNEWLIQTLFIYKFTLESKQTISGLDAINLVVTDIFCQSFFYNLIWPFLIAFYLSWFPRSP